jgi:hypothetical protein
VFDKSVEEVIEQLTDSVTGLSGSFSVSAAFLCCPVTPFFLVDFALFRKINLVPDNKNQTGRPAIVAEHVKPRRKVRKARLTCDVINNNRRNRLTEINGR